MKIFIDSTAAADAWKRQSTVTSRSFPQIAAIQRTRELAAHRPIIDRGYNKKIEILSLDCQNRDKI